MYLNPVSVLHVPTVYGVLELLYELVFYEIVILHHHVDNSDHHLT